MKTILRLTTGLVLGAVLFTGCKKEEGCMDALASNYNADAKKDDGSCLYDPPVISTFTIDGGSATSGDHTPGDTINFNFVIADDISLSSFDVEEEVVGGSGGSVSIHSESISGTTEEVVYDYIVSSTATEGTSITLTFLISNEQGEESSKTYTVNVISDATPLSADQAFSWIRCGSNNPDLSGFGLSWTSNTASSAIVKKDADKLVILTSADWTNITTFEDLMAAVDAGTDVAQYEGVSVTDASKTYDDVIATKMGAQYFIFNVTSSTAVDKTATCGFEITINGNFKN